MTKKIVAIAITILAFFSLINTTLAIPGVPHAFYGYVVVNSAPALDGTVIIAKINNVEVARTTTKDGRYGYPLGSFYVDDPNNNRAGKEVRFFVNNVDTVQVLYFCNGCVTMLNLTATTQTGQQAGTTGGGGGGGTTEQPSQTTNQTVTQQQACQEKWVCSEWSECINGVQTRTCVDQNNCGTNNKEPFTSQPCSAEERKEEKSSQGVSGITGFFALISNPVYALGLILVIIAIVILVLTFFLSRRKK